MGCAAERGKAMGLGQIVSGFEIALGRLEEAYQKASDCGKEDYLFLRITEFNGLSFLLKFSGNV